MVYAKSTNYYHIEEPANIYQVDLMKVMLGRKLETNYEENHHKKRKISC